MIKDSKITLPFVRAAKIFTKEQLTYPKYKLCIVEPDPTSESGNRGTNRC